LQINFSGKENFISRRLCVSGDLKYGVPNLDPFFFKEVTVQQYGVSLSTRDVYVYGGKDANLQDIK
jgi:hypothetical protein